MQNPYNLGSILRSAAAYRCERVWLVPPTPGLGHAKVAKTALGSERLVTVEALEPPTNGADAVAMAEFARAAHAHGEPVHATVWIRERVDKGDPAAATVEHPWVLVRLADRPKT